MHTDTEAFIHNALATPMCACVHANKQVFTQRMNHMQKNASLEA